MRTTVAALAAAGAAGAVVIGSAVPATASEGRTEVTRGSVSLPIAPAVECGDGAIVGLAFDVVYTEHTTTDASGALVRTRLTIRYDGAFVDLFTGARSDTVHGTANSMLDFTTGLHTVSGNQRSLTVPGEGKVLHEAGHVVLDLESGDALVERGPKLGEVTVEGAEAVCGLFGRTGGSPL